MIESKEEFPSESDLVSQVKNLDPTGSEFAEVLAAMAGMTATLRSEKGRVPYDVFIASLELLGIYPCFEVIVRDIKGNLYLKRRHRKENVSEAEQTSWGEKLQIPGTTVFPAKSLGMNYYDLLDKEVIELPDEVQKKELLDELYQNSKVVGVALYPEPERKTDALTIFMQVVVNDLNILKEGFEQVTGENLFEVIDQHRPTVERLLQYQEGLFLFDSRGKE